MENLSTGPEKLLAFAKKRKAEREKAAERNRPDPPPPSSKSSSSLGKVDVRKYLNHYGVEIVEEKPDPKSGGTRFVIYECVFDSNHRGKEASITQTDKGLGYQCFHATCPGHASNKAWLLAREKISGSDSMAPFMEGYDPNYKPSQKKNAGGEFIVISERGKVSIRKEALSVHLQEKFGPLQYEGDHTTKQLYRYDEKDGLWKLFQPDTMWVYARKMLGENAQLHPIEEAVRMAYKTEFTDPKEIDETRAGYWNLLCVKNGMVDVSEPPFELIPHDKKYFSRAQMPVNFDPEAVCPLWENTLLEIFDDDHDKIQVVQQFFGYCLYADLPFPAALFLIGEGRNGKGTIEDQLVNLLTYRNVSNISLSGLEDTFAPQNLKNKLLNVSNETTTKPIDIANFKSLTSNNLIEANVKHGPNVQFKPIAKHMYSMNQFPSVSDRSNALYRRIIVIEFKQTFEGAKDNKKLKYELPKEMDGIFMWALEGLEDVLENMKITVTENISEAKEDFRIMTNPMLLWLDECCWTGPGNEVLPNDAHKNYEKWMSINEKNRKPMGRSTFYAQMKQAIPSIKKKRIGTKEYWEGIGLQR